MKIALIGPGIMPIPPPAWGAVEILIWDYYNELTILGHDVVIINTPNKNEIIEIVNRGNFDFVHLHYDVFYPILEFLKCPKIAITSHYPYIDNFTKHRYDGYERIFQFLINQTKIYNFVLAKKDMDAFIQSGAKKDFIRKIKNGINSKLFHFNENPLLKTTIYLGKITYRKNQAKYQSLLNVDFVGRKDDFNFNTNNSNYLGEWTREKIHKELTNYSNLLLISDGEADPLVIKEALICGLGIVVNQASSENLDCSKEFITVLDDSKLNDLQYIQEKLSENIEKSSNRKEIRKYGIDNFDIKKEVIEYLDNVSNL
jgi:hypothetical protein